MLPNHKLRTGTSNIKRPLKAPAIPKHKYNIRMLKLFSILNINKWSEQIMHERHYGEIGTHHDMGKKWMMKKMMWEQLDDDAKKQYVLRKLDEKIMKCDCPP
jgi:hypothetical protein